MIYRDVAEYNVEHNGADYPNTYTAVTLVQFHRRYGTPQRRVRIEELSAGIGARQVNENNTLINTWQYISAIQPINCDNRTHTQL